MLEILTCILFVLILIITIFLGKPILLALFINLILFITYSRIRKYSFKSIFNMISEGIISTSVILTVFLLIGMATGLWRASGTISYLIITFSKLISPKFFYVGIFLFNSLISLLTGSSFAAASTSGIISMSLSSAFSMNPLITGGAILSGAFFGDRISPMSTSALLVATMTKTDIYVNIKNMFKTCIIPFILTLITFQAFNLNYKALNTSNNLSLLAEAFNFNLILILPALIIIVLSIFKINIRITMALSVISAMLLTFFIQHENLFDIFRYMFFGYYKGPEMIHGGGIISMIKVSIIVSISSGYFGIFKDTELLYFIKEILYKAFEKFPDVLVLTIISLIVSLFSSNQTLTVMLTYELSHNSIKDKYKLALDLENTAILTPLYIPYNIAGRTPLDIVAAPISSIPFCFYTHYVIIYNIILDYYNSKKRKH